MATSVLRYAVAAVTDLGRKRPTNEDAYGFSAEHGVYLVCDGMGGAAAGEVASSVAVEVVLRQLSNRAWGDPVPLREVVEEAVRSANEAIHSRAQRSPQLNGMGTTLVGLMAEGPHVLVFNVGDSRCYRLHNLSMDPNRMNLSRLEQVTQDHSLVSEQVQMGRMTQDEALTSPLRNVITRALGTQSTVLPDLYELEAEAGEIFLLCSDGLSGELTDPLMESMLAVDLPLEDLCARLVNAANIAGGHDNITCLLVRAES